ncbi:protein-methionine-sulfoxide reductase heme-binding subunit MsrQ [Tianweitania sp.]|uniref:protein-methionine-sulfoxide reductase heme-binding subunit MsrQ n=1 Tax=Tianweitania sp. TaxID=2021634 RepID=UPI0028A209DE|nr:protein-methionine-sulfoxide reductase heme-binding subunit MsrQ [Tianweitania sp.]
MIARIDVWLKRVPNWAVWLAGFIPLAWLVWLVISNDLGVDPVKEIEHRLGKIALWFLIGGLVITPLRKFVGLNLLRYRRAIGLLAFIYVVLHLMAWAVFDMGLLLSQAANDLFRRPYLIFGISAFILLIPLAITSNKASIRKLGANWRRLHWLVYPAVLLGVVHYLWQMKVIRTEGWIWLAVALLLLATRIKFPKSSR